MVQLAFTASLLGQLFDAEKSLFALMELTESAALVVFVIVIAWLELVLPRACIPNATYVGEKLTMAAVPVPVTELVWPPPVPLSVTTTVEEWAPELYGWKMTVTEQLDPAASDVPHVLLVE